MSFWKTEGADDLLKKLRSEGKSFSECAAVISWQFKVRITRNACISRSTRNGMVILNRERKPSKVATPKPKRGPLAAFLKSRPVTMLELEPPADELPKVSLLDLEPPHCRFPIGTPGTPGFGFCGDNHIPGVSYCERHALRCYTPATPRTERLRDFQIRRIVGFKPKVFEDA